MNEEEKRYYKRAKWEAKNNPSVVQVRDPLFGYMDVDTMLLILPLEYANGDRNLKMRELAIEQGTFKPAPKE